MHGRCGLINSANPCRCEKKTQGFIKAGYLDPDKLLFARAHVTQVHEVAPSAVEGLEALDAAYGRIHREHPFHTAPDFVAALRTLLDRPDYRSLLAG